MLIDHQYIRYGFCYGDYLKKESIFVNDFINNDKLLNGAKNITDINSAFNFYKVENEGIIEVNKDIVNVSDLNFLKEKLGR